MEATKHIRSRKALDRIVTAVEEHDTYDALRVVEVPEERNRPLRIGFDERPVAAEQATTLQETITSTVPIFPDVEVYRVDLVNNEILITEVRE